MNDLLSNLAKGDSVTLVSNGDHVLAISPEELRKIDQATADDAGLPECENCGARFEPRKRSGGKPQKYCGEECRRLADAQRGQRAPTRSDDLQSDPADKLKEQLAALPPDQQKMVRNAVDQCKGAILRQQEERKAAAMAIDEANGEQTLLAPRNETTIQHSEEHGAWIIKQKAWPNDDAEIWIEDNNMHEFLDRLCDVVGIPSAGRH